MFYRFDSFFQFLSLLMIVLVFVILDLSIKHCKCVCRGWIIINIIFFFQVFCIIHLSLCCHIEKPKDRDKSEKERERVKMKTKKKTLKYLHYNMQARKYYMWNTHLHTHVCTVHFCVVYLFSSLLVIVLYIWYLHWICN